MDKNIDLNKRYYPIKFKKEENTDVLKFAAIQSNFADAVRYLIEKEIAENGIRNLSNFIPQNRTKEYFETLLGSRQNTISSEISMEKIDAVSKVTIVQQNDKKEIVSENTIEEDNESKKDNLDINNSEHKEEKEELETIVKDHEKQQGNESDENQDDKVDPEVLACYM